MTIDRLVTDEPDAMTCECCNSGPARFLLIYQARARCKMLYCAACTEDAVLELKYGKEVRPYWVYDLVRLYTRLRRPTSDDD